MVVYNDSNTAFSIAQKFKLILVFSCKTGTQVFQPTTLWMSLASITFASCPWRSPKAAPYPDTGSPKMKPIHGCSVSQVQLALSQNVSQQSPSIERFRLASLTTCCSPQDPLFLYSGASLCGDLWSHSPLLCL